MAQPSPNKSETGPRRPRPRSSASDAKARDSAADSPPPVPTVAGEGDVSPEELLRLVKELHDAYADERISLDEFEERKQELVARITV